MEIPIEGFKHLEDATHFLTTNERQIRYRGDAILDFLRGINSDSVDKLLIFWLDKFSQLFCTSPPPQKNAFTYLC